ncbi:BA14K family protein [Alsobacter sp. KACC 23698]|uniref:Lectin-like protein BA14k n=1 Tax=Alsobacter sp. KACC 23698 TaxID=3149229 RepID=A0AAU7JG56_9HYPH
MRIWLLVRITAVGVLMVAALALFRLQQGGSGFTGAAALFGTNRDSVSAATGTVVRAPTSDKLAPAAPPPGPVIRVTTVPVGPSPLVSPAPSATAPAAPAKPADAARPQPQPPAPAAVSAADFAASFPPKLSTPLPGPGPDSAQPQAQPAPTRAARAPAQEQGDAAAPPSSADAPRAEARKGGDKVASVAPARTRPAFLSGGAGQAGCTRYKSYDPATQTYRSYDGVTRECKPRR